MDVSVTRPSSGGNIELQLDAGMGVDQATWILSLFASDATRRDVDALPCSSPSASVYPFGSSLYWDIARTAIPSSCQRQ